MKHLFTLILTIVVIVCSACLSKNSSIKKSLSVKITNPDMFENVFNKYLYKKEHDELIAITIYLSESRILNDKKAISPMTGFYMGIIHEQPDVYKEIKELDLSKNMKLVLNLAEEYSSETEDILDNKLNKSPRPAYLDLLWGYFIATGDKRVINKMCYYSKHANDPLVRGAADWSYKSNQKQFPELITECKI